MPHFSAERKHEILLEYSPRSATHDFAALTQRHSVGGGARVVRRWHERWNGSAASLQRRPGTGSAPILSRAEVTRHVRAPIIAANRAHRAVHYTDLLAKVKRKTRKQLSLRTLRRYGQQQLRAKDKHTTKRTAQEGECADT